jgi:copper chaperone CopZ
MKFIKSFVLAFIVLIATASIAFSQTTNTNQITDSTKTLTLKVKGITCSTDLKTIAANVEKLKGVSSCTAGKMGTTSSFIVIYNPTLVTEKEVNVAIENTAGCENPDDRPYKVKQ